MSDLSMDRYAVRLCCPQIGTAGQAKLARARFAGGVRSAQDRSWPISLARAGVGFLRIVDRDIVEMTNLQRQVLFDEERRPRRESPKAIAAARRLGQVNSSITIEPNGYRC